MREPRECRRRGACYAVLEEYAWGEREQGRFKPWHAVMVVPPPRLPEDRPSAARMQSVATHAPKPRVMLIASLPARLAALSVRAAMIAIAIAIFGALAAAAQQREAPGLNEFDVTVRPLLQEYCIACHSTEQQKGELDLERFASQNGARKEPQLWQLVSEKLRNLEMPPAEKPQPPPTQRAKLLAWIESTLDDLAREHAGDPGPVVLRRLSNAEYTYSVRDLTGVASLDPAREFPVDGAAGEGFMNVGNALVMSPALLTKYFDAAKAIADHALLLEDGIRFSPGATRRDQSEDRLLEIRNFYRQYTDPGGGEIVNLQGIVFTTNAGGRLPLEKYLAATIELRDAKLAQGGLDIAAVARARGLSPKYLATLLAALTDSKPALLLDPIRTAWRASAAQDVEKLAAQISAWQKSLWKFSSVGQIGKSGGPKAWMEPVDPLSESQELRIALPALPAVDAAQSAGSQRRTIYLVAGDAGDGADHDVVIWQAPRFVAKGRPDLLLRDVRTVTLERQARRARLFRGAQAALAACAEVELQDKQVAQSSVDFEGIARRHGLAAGDLASWLEYLGLGPCEPARIDACFTAKLDHPSDYAFISGWGSAQTPLVLANSSDEHVRIPGNMQPHSVAVHPSPALRALVGWRSHAPASLRVEAKIQHAHPECGNGVAWSLELRRGVQRRVLASGFAQGGDVEQPPPLEKLQVRPGDVVALSIGARDGNHACDLTAVDLTLTSADAAAPAWDLGADCSSDLTAANPHADRFGQTGVWSFSTEPDSGPDSGSVTGARIPQASILARWLLATNAQNATEQARCAGQLQELLDSGGKLAPDGPDAALYRQLASLGGPLLAQTADEGRGISGAAAASGRGVVVLGEEFGLDPARFGVDLAGQPIDEASFCTKAPSVVAIAVPSELVEGAEFVTTGALSPRDGAEGSVQLEARLTTDSAFKAGLVPSEATLSEINGAWTSNNQRIQFAVPVIVHDGSAARRRVLAALDEFRALFPGALCYAKIVPVDEAVTLTQFYREDQALVRLMLDDAQARQLDQLWADFHFVAQDALSEVDAFDQIYQFATQDADPKVFEPLREPIRRAAAVFREEQRAAEPAQIDAVLEFADRAWRRPLSTTERDELRGLYPKLRGAGLAHDEAIRLMLARVLIAPAFLYHRELPEPGTQAAPLNDFELASRLSYFLWSSVPDDELRAVAAAGRLQRDEELLAQTRRMLKDARVRRLATEFGCAWLHVYGFDQLSDKSERHFPTFEALRGDMYEETIRFFTEMFQTNAPVRDLLDADYTFLDQALATHYGIPGVVGTQWRRVDGVKAFSRGGLLGFATTLAAQSGASRTSPILRGNWVCEALLADKLPRPPKNVPKLPEDEAGESLTIRELVERHSQDPGCMRCHQRMDAFGLALEGFDAIGRLRTQDLGGRPLDTRAKTMDGSQFEGLSGLRDYLLTKRRDDFNAQFCRKLLGYALGRAVQISDRPLQAEMAAGLAGDKSHMNDIVEAIVLSRQFRTIRGRDELADDADLPDGEGKR